MLTPSSSRQLDVLERIIAERKRQDTKWGPIPRPNHDFGRWLTILIEEVGEASEADLKHMETETTYELVQAAAVLVAWLEQRLY